MKPIEQKHNVLGTDIPEKMLNRFKILSSMLSGKQDISTGREDMDIIADVPLSASTIRSFLAQLVEQGYVDKKFIRAGGIPCGPGWSSHNEYTLSTSGLRYVEAQVKLWIKAGIADNELATNILLLLPLSRERRAATTRLLKSMEKRLKKMGI